MRVTTRLYWTPDHSRIVPKMSVDAAELFAREGAEVSREIVEQYGLTDFVEGQGESAKAKPRRGRER